MSVTMWEVRAVDGRVAELLDWLTARLPAGSQLYQSRPVPGPDQSRVVVIDPSGTAAVLLADPPAELVARPPHAWDFERVGNG